MSRLAQTKRDKLVPARSARYGWKSSRVHSFISRQEGWAQLVDSSASHHCLKTALNRINGAILPNTLGAAKSTKTCSTGGFSNHLRRGTGCGAWLLQSFKMKMTALLVDSLGYFLSRTLPTSKKCCFLVFSGALSALGSDGHGPSMAK